ncbi:MAG: hypothetical protein H0W58_18305 [Acidobacteria bacterium]|jgi:adenylate kinase family enzyme|nr:hypothetical protein [Acidobacteriota bacterium]
MAKVLTFEIPEKEYIEFKVFLKMAVEEMQKSREKMREDQVEIDRLDKKIEQLRSETAEYKAQSDEVLERLEAKWLRAA